MNCILCQQLLDVDLCLSDILLFRKEKAQVCARCQATFVRIEGSSCSRCGRKMKRSNICSDCMEWQEKRGVIVRHQALYTYNQAMKSYMSRYKFVGDYYLRYAFTEEFKTFLKPLMKNYRLVPVPVSPDTMKKRGFNQVIGFLEGAGLPYYSLFAKEDSHIKQSSRNRSERLLASHGFHLIDKVNLPKQILLVDDIYTTGVTLNTLRALLFNAGVYDIRSFSLAR